MKINGTTLFIWAAVDLDDEKIIATWVSFGRSGTGKFSRESMNRWVKAFCGFRNLMKDPKGVLS